MVWLTAAPSPTKTENDHPIPSHRKMMHVTDASNPAVISTDDSDDAVVEEHSLFHKSIHTINSCGMTPSTPPTTASSIIRKQSSLVMFDFDPYAIQEKISSKTTDKGNNDGDDCSNYAVEDENDCVAVADVEAKVVVVEDRVFHEIQLGKTLTRKKGFKKLAIPNLHTEYIEFCYNRKRIERNLDCLCPPTDNQRPTIGNKMKRPTNTPQISNTSSRRKLAMKISKEDDNEVANRRPTITKNIERPTTQKTSNSSSRRKLMKIISQEDDNKADEEDISHIDLRFDTVIPISHVTQQPQPIPVTLASQSSTNIMMEQRQQPNQHLRRKPCPKPPISTTSPEPSSQPQPQPQPQPQTATLVPQSDTNIMVEQHQPNQHLRRKPCPESTSIPSSKQLSIPHHARLVPQSNTNSIVEQHQQNQHVVQKLSPEIPISTPPHILILPTPTSTTSTEIPSFIVTNGAFSQVTTDTIKEKSEDEIIPIVADINCHHAKQHAEEILHNPRKKQWRSIRRLAEDVLERDLGTKESMVKALDARHDVVSSMSEGGVDTEENTGKALETQYDAVSSTFLNHADEIDYQKNPFNWIKVESPAFVDPRHDIDHLQNSNSFQHETNSDGSEAVPPASFYHGNEINYEKKSNSFQHDTESDMGNVVSPLKSKMLYDGHIVKYWKHEQEDNRKFDKDLNPNTILGSSRGLSMDCHELTPPLRLTRYPAVDDDHNHDLSYSPKKIVTLSKDQSSRTHPYHTEINYDHGRSYEPLEFSLFLKDQPSQSFHRNNDNLNNIPYTPEKVAILIKLPRFVDGKDATSATMSITLNQPSIHTMHSLCAAETLSSSYSSGKNPNIISLKTRLQQVRGRVDRHLTDIRVRNDKLFSSSSSALVSVSALKGDTQGRLSSMSSSFEKEANDVQGGMYADLPNLMDSMLSSDDDVTDNNADHHHLQMTTKSEKYKPDSPKGVDEFDCEAVVRVKKANQLKKSSYFTSEVATIVERMGTRLNSDVGRADNRASAVAVLLASNDHTKNLRVNRVATSAKITRVKGRHYMNVENKYILQLKARLRQIERKVHTSKLYTSRVLVR